MGRDTENLEWMEERTIQVLETMVREEQLEKMKSLLKRRSREALVVSFRSFRIVFNKRKMIFFILIFLEDNNLLTCKIRKTK